MNDKTLKVSRIEEKYLISTNKKIEIIKELKKILSFDEFGEQGKYTIRTLYFDTPSYEDYTDKLLDKKVRKGLRMRIYSYKDKKAKLELKMKNEIQQEKISLKILKEDSIEIINKNYECLKKYDCKESEIFYNILKNGNYEPKTYIAYKRMAFDCKERGVRITIDSEIATSNTEFNIWSENLTANFISGVNEHILEIKRKEELKEEIKLIVFPVEIEEKPFSKYRRCCRFLTF